MRLRGANRYELAISLLLDFYAIRFEHEGIGPDHCSGYTEPGVRRPIGVEAADRQIITEKAGDSNPTIRL